MTTEDCQIVEEEGTSQGAEEGSCQVKTTESNY